jgi:hypothetical protein
MLSRLLGVAVLLLAGIVSPANSASVGFIYSGGSYTTFAVPGASNTWAFGINNEGEIVGSYRDVYSGGVYTTLDYPLGPGTQAFSLWRSL